MLSQFTSRDLINTHLFCDKPSGDYALFSGVLTSTPLRPQLLLSRKLRGVQSIWFHVYVRIKRNFNWRHTLKGVNSIQRAYSFSNLTSMLPNLHFSVHSWGWFDGNASVVGPPGHEILLSQTWCYVILHNWRGSSAGSWSGALEEKLYGSAYGMNSMAGSTHSWIPGS